MTRSKTSRRLVIDASVARASGSEDATFPTSKHARELLLAVQEFCHRLVLTDDIFAEWRNHRSKFARQWLTNMYGRKKVVHITDTLRDDLRQKLLTGVSAKAHEIMEKDIILLEAALSTDRIVISLDDNARVEFSLSCLKVGEIGSICWRNPDESGLHEWLESGADSRPDIELRNYKRS